MQIQAVRRVLGDDRTLIQPVAEWGTALLVSCGAYLGIKSLDRLYRAVHQPARSEAVVILLLDWAI